MKRKFLWSFLLLVCLPGWSPRAQDAPGLDGEGFIKNWLVLAPIPSENETNGYAEVDKEQVKGEAALRPKEGDKAIVGGKELTWKKVIAADYFIDLKEVVGRGQSEDVVGYAVTYLTSDAEQTGLKLKIGTNDEAKLYLNGKPIFKFEEARPLSKDESTIDNVTLNKGLNVLVFKLINEKNDWQGALRFTDKNGAPVKNIKIATAAGQG